MKGVHTSLNFLAVLIIVLFSFSNSYSSDLLGKYSEGNKVIMIRHSKAPGFGDPDGFNLKDCKTQRNLSNEGIEQSKRIGKLFKQNKILIDKNFLVNGAGAKIPLIMLLINMKFLKVSILLLRLRTIKMR